MIHKLFRNSKEIILYIFFGGCTTMVNIVTYYICTRIYHFNMLYGTVAAWLLAVIFAYLTNKKYVFHSENHTLRSIVIEFLIFLFCRLFTGGVDIGIMYLFVTVFKFNDLVIKIFSNAVIIISNYLASRVLIFKKHE